MCDRYAAAIEQAAATGFVPTDERKAAISGWLAQCAMTLSAAAHAWLTLHGIE